MEIKDKVVLITGSSLGIGRETAIAFAKEGAIPIITYYNDKKEGEKVKEEVLKYVKKTSLYKLNVKDNESIKETVRKAIEEFGNIDILINNAGVIHWKELKDTTFEEIEEQIRVNLEGLIKMTKEVMEESNLKMVINIASGAGKTGYGGLSVYCATKFGVRGFSEALSKEVNFDVIVVNPRSTKTRMTNYKGDDPEKVAELIVKAAKKEIDKFEIDVWDYL